MDNSELFSRILDKIDVFEVRLDSTCNMITEIKTTLVDFIDTVEKREEDAKMAVDKKYKNITVVFGSVTLISVFITIGKTLGVF